MIKYWWWLKFHFDQFSLNSHIFQTWLLSPVIGFIRKLYDASCKTIPSGGHIWVLKHVVLFHACINLFYYLRTKNGDYSKCGDQKWAVSWQNQQNGMCVKQRLRSAWASIQSDQSLRCPHEESLGPYLPIEHTAKTLISLGGCPGWSESSLGAQTIWLVLSWDGSREDGNKESPNIHRIIKDSFTTYETILLLLATTFNIHKIQTEPYIFVIKSHYVKPLEDYSAFWLWLQWSWL